MTKDMKTVGTLQEIGARVGDVVGNSWGTIGRTVDQDMINNWKNSDYRIVSRAAPDYMDGEWHDWAGGECPVPGDVMVEVEFLGEGGCTLPAHSHGWSDYITRFRVVQSSEEAPNSPVDGEVRAEGVQVAQKQDGRQNELYEAGIRTHREAIAWAIGALEFSDSPQAVGEALKDWLEAQA